MNAENYPGIIERVKAFVFDTFIMVVFMFITAFIFNHFENVTDNARMIAFIFIYLLYDPLFTSLFGGTIGHMIVGVRVKRSSNEQKNIFFLLAIPRYLAKVTLGWISLLSVSGNKKKMAIHDFLVGSVVIYANEEMRKNENSDAVQNDLT